MKRFAALSFIFVTGCATIVYPVVSIERIDGDRFTSCLISLNETEDATRSACGPPLRELVTDFGDRCALYENLGHALRFTEAPAPYVVVCFEERSVRSPSGGRRGQSEADPKGKASRVASVFGLRAISTSTVTERGAR